MQDGASGPCPNRSTAAPTASWQLRPASSVIRLLRVVMRIGSGKFRGVKWNECRKPLPVFAAYCPASACGVWQSLHDAAWWWLDETQPEYCSCITWQFAQARGSFVRYEYPFA